MSQENYIAKLLEMEEAIIENVEKTDNFTFPNAKPVADRFHYTRCCTEAVEAVRKRV